MERAKHIIYIILILSITAGCYYLHTLSQQLEKVMIFQNELIKYHVSNDTLSTDTAKIKYINTDINDENKGTEENLRNQ